MDIVEFFLYDEFSIVTESANISIFSFNELNLYRFLSYQFVIFNPVKLKFPKIKRSFLYV